MSEIANIESQKKQHSEIVKSFDLKETNEKIEKCKKAIALKNQYENMKKDVRSKRDELNIKIMAFNAAINAKTQDVDKLERQIKEIGESGKFLCTECKSLVTKEHVLKKIADNKKLISENQELMKPVQEHLDKTIEAQKTVESRLEQISKYSIEEGKYQLAVSEYKSAQDNLGHYDDHIKNHSNRQEALAKEMEETKSKLEEYSNKCKAIESTYQQEVSTLDATIAKLRAEVIELKKDASEVEKKILETKETLKKVHEDREALNKAIGSLQKEIESVIDLGKRIADEKKALKDESRHLRRYIILEKAFGLDGVQTRIVQKYLPLLNMYIKEYLDILSEGKMSIKMLVNDKSKVDMVISGGTADSYNMLSGGEKMIVRLAVDIGLALLSFSRTAKNPDMICLDEIFGPLDKRHTSAVFRMLRELKNRFSRVFLISHKANIQSLVKNNVVIEKSVGNHGLSKITGIKDISV
jgi:DNA repair exonuclease SbcCD ATPase subunit